MEELASQEQPVQLALENPVLHHFFTGTFMRSEPVSFEPDRVIAVLKCTLPPEVIAYLGSTNDPVRVRLLWRPVLTGQPTFLLSLLTFAASFAVLTTAIRRTRKVRAAGIAGMENAGMENEGEATGL